MAHLSDPLPLTEASIVSAYSLVRPYIHQTPVLTSKTLNLIASTPQPAEALVADRAFKVRGAFHALLRLVQAKGAEEVRRRGVITHSAGNHAQALALAAQALNIPAYVVMPSIAIPSKIDATRAYGATIMFSGPTSQEREAVAEKVQAETGAIFVSSANDPDIILGQGTTGLELGRQARDLVAANPTLSVHVAASEGDAGENARGEHGGGAGALDAVITPIGCGGLNAGVATYFASRPQTRVFGVEPSFEGADDCRRGLAAGQRITVVKTLTIADVLRQPVGTIPWTVISDPLKVRGVYAVSEEQIKAAMRLALEHMKVVVEPSGAVGLAAALFNEDFRALVEQEAPGGWDVGVVLSGGNTMVKAIAQLYG